MSIIIITKLLAFNGQPYDICNFTGLSMQFCFCIIEYKTPCREGERLSLSVNLSKPFQCS